MKQRISFEHRAPGFAEGFYIRDYDFPHPIGPFETIAEAHNWLNRARREARKKVEAKYGAANSTRK